MTYANNIISTPDYSHRSYKKHIKLKAALARIGSCYKWVAVVFFTVCLIMALVGNH